jgi:hypothetical protein
MSRQHFFGDHLNRLTAAHHDQGTTMAATEVDLSDGQRSLGQVAARSIRKGGYGTP